MNLRFCIDTREKRALDICLGSMICGEGFGEGFDWGNGSGDGWGDGMDGDSYGDGYGDSFGIVSGDSSTAGYYEVHRHPRAGDGCSSSVWR